MQWAARRPATRVTHLDSAAAGRSSHATLAASAAHARREAEVGAYVAQEEAHEQLEVGRRSLAALLGVPPAGLAFLESASVALGALLASWPLSAGDTVGVVAAEWGPNLEAFAARGLRVVELVSDGDGALDLHELERRLADDPPTVVHLTQVTSHRGLVQPVAAAVELCRVAGVACWVDAAQALGHVDAATGADASYATSRKWLAGPRGVGMLAIAERAWRGLEVRRSALAPDDLAPVAHLESHEAHIAGRVGLAVAVADYLESGADRVAHRLDEVGRLTREALAEVPGWRVVGSGAGAITAVAPTAGQEVLATRSRLLAEHGVLTTACAPARAPRELTAPVLRISAHVDCTAADLARLTKGLRVS